MQLLQVTNCRVKGLGMKLIALLHLLEGNWHHAFSISLFSSCLQWHRYQVGQWLHFYQWYSRSLYRGKIGLYLLQFLGQQWCSCGLQATGISHNRCVSSNNIKFKTTCRYIYVLDAPILLASYMYGSNIKFRKNYWVVKLFSFKVLRLWQHQIIILWLRTEKQ